MTLKWVKNKGAISKLLILRFDCFLECAHLIGCYIVLIEQLNQLRLLLNQRVFDRSSWLQPCGELLPVFGNACSHFFRSKLRFLA